MRKSIVPLAVIAAGVMAAASPAIANAHPAMGASPAPSRPLALVQPAKIVDPAAIDTLRSRLTAGTLASSGLVGTSGCGNTVGGRTLLCDLDYLTAPGSASPLSTATPAGYGPADLQKAYGVSKAPSRSGTIVVVEAGAYPNLEADLSVYRAQYGLGSCTVANGCFKQESFTGGAPYAPQPIDGLNGLAPYYEWTLSLETALDVDMASAVCPKCHVTEIQIPFIDGLPSTVDQALTSAHDFTAATRLANAQGASTVSISYGLPTSSYQSDGTPSRIDYDQDNPNVTGTAVFASTGDSSYLGADETFPANQSTVIAAGGTSLYQTPKTRSGFTETAWSGAGSGCSTTEAEANGQPAKIAADCGGHRASADLSAVADPYTGVAIYNAYVGQCLPTVCSPSQLGPIGWATVGGTSVASPILAGLNARAGVAPDVNGPNHVYAAPESAYHDITLGSNARPGACAADGYANAVCVSGRGWDGPTGLGSPRGLQTFLW